MLPNSGENIIPVTSASSAVARSHTAAQSPNVFSCNYQWNAGFQIFPQPVITDQNAQITVNYNIIQLLVFKETNISITKTSPYSFSNFRKLSFSNCFMPI